MARFMTTRRSEWLPGVALLGAAVGIAALLGVSLGVRSWALYIGLIALALLGLGWVERWRVRRATALPRRPKTRLKVLPGGKYDLEKDDSTDDQKYVM
jgi:hypothetical protein